MLSIDEARDRILERVGRLGVEDVPVDAAAGRVLAADLVAGEAIPPFDNSAMDGYAVRAADTGGASDESPVSLRAIGEVPAGATADMTVGEGEAVRIMTGAPMPAGADAVVMVEHTAEYARAREGAARAASDTSVSSPDTVTILKPVSVGENVRFSGEDVSPGLTVIERGTRLNAAHIGLAAALGHAELTVSARPTVAVISTGDELVEPGVPLGPGQIRNSNAFSIAAQVAEAGGVPLRLGIAKDTEEDVRAKLREGLERADVVVTTGGVSVGDYDVVKAVLESLGDMVFWKVAMKPGKPLAFGVLEGKPVFGVPGNPATSLVIFEMFIRPALLAMQGRASFLRPVVEAILDSPMKKKGDRTHLARGVVHFEADGAHARPAGPQGSAVLTTMAKANALLWLERDRTAYEAGDRVRAILLRCEED